MNKKREIEFRYYEIPQGSPLIALLGERWILHYGSENLHFHNYLEVGYCHYGKGVMTVGEGSEEYSTGTFTVIPRNFSHRTTSMGDTVSRWEYLFIDVDGFLRDIYKEKPIMAVQLIERINKNGYCLRQEEHPQAARLICNILEEMREKKELYEENVRGCLLALLIEIARLNEDSAGWRQNSEQNVKRILKTLEYVDKHYREQIRMAELAEICHLSETHFRRIFQKITNTTPNEYLNLIRIQKACGFLRKTDKSVEEIRVMVGFPTASTFNRNFRRFVGMSPAQWRDKTENTIADYRVSVYKGW